jgi:hypothetical protein
MDARQKTLTDLFRKLGARDPEPWAASLTAEGIPQVARFPFLRGAWRNVVPEEDTTWLQSYIEMPAVTRRLPSRVSGWRSRGCSQSGLTA